MRRRQFLTLALSTPAMLLGACGNQEATPGDTARPTTAVPRAAQNELILRLGVQMTPQELASFRPAVEQLQVRHPEWRIQIEELPQASASERLNAQLAAGKLPDVQHIQGLFAQQLIRQNAFLDLTGLLAAATRQDLYAGALAQFGYGDKIWGMPFSAAPDVVFFSPAIFDAAGEPYPTDDWDFDQMRAVARRLTRDAAGRAPGAAGFDPQNIVQWGWGVTPAHIWSRFLLVPLGGEICADAACSRLRLTDPGTIDALQWWADMASLDHSVPYDPYGGSQTGVPGEAFVAGKAAMSTNGFFAVGQLNTSGTQSYDIVQPLKGRDGRRTTALSVQGFAVAATSSQPEAAWQLVQELTTGDFMAAHWARPGHGVPARRSAAEAILDPSRPPKNQRAILQAMEYAEVLRPDTAGAFEAFSKTSGLFQQAMKGELPVAQAAAEIERQANEALARDR